LHGASFAAGALRTRVEFCHGCGVGELALHLGDSAVAAFIDPPYTAGGRDAGSRLYRHVDVDHERVFVLAGQMRGHALLTYDDNRATRALAVRNGLDTRAVTVRTAHHRLATELLIGRDLGWLRLAASPSGNATSRHVVTRRDVASDGPVRLVYRMSDDAAPEGFATVSEAADQLNVTRRTVERLAQSGELERHRAENGRVFITGTSLCAALAKRQAPRPKPARTDLVSALAGIERLVAELRDDRRMLLEAVTDREAARLELAEARAALEHERARRAEAELALQSACSEPAGGVSLLHVPELRGDAAS
jgi:excisionase family DNA binding protein